MLCAFLAMASLESCSAESGSERTPNVLVVLLDTLRADHLTTHGYKRNTSPLLDAFAEKCFVFEGAQSCAPWTGPSLISIMTSLYPDVHGVSSNVDPATLPQDVDTLAELLSRRGYRTGAFTEGGFAGGTYGLEQGFDLYKSNGGAKQIEVADGASKGRLESNLAQLLGWLEEGSPDEPFFGFFQTYEIHTPYEAPEEYVQLYEQDYDGQQEHADCVAAIEKWNADQQLTKEQLILLQRHMLHCNYAGMPALTHTGELLEYSKIIGAPLTSHEMSMDPHLMPWAKNVYDAEIDYTDKVLQRLWDALEDSGQLENTIIVIVSDHGEGLGDHGKLGHGQNLYEELLNVVLMVHVPLDGFEPRRLPYRARTVDIMPTVLELLDVASGKSPIQGQSLVDILQDGPREAPASFSHVSAWGTDAHSILENDWRLIIDHRNDGTELYNLAQDPKELNNLAKAHPEVVKRLQGLLSSQRSVDAKLRKKVKAGKDKAHVDAAAQEELRGLGYGGGMEDAAPKKE